MKPAVQVIMTLCRARESPQNITEKMDTGSDHKRVSVTSSASGILLLLLTSLLTVEQVAS